VVVLHGPWCPLPFSAQTWWRHLGILQWWKQNQRNLHNCQPRGGGIQKLLRNGPALTYWQSWMLRITPKSSLFLTQLNAFDWQRLCLSQYSSSCYSSMLACQGVPSQCSKLLHMTLLKKLLSNNGPHPAHSQLFKSNHGLYQSQDDIKQPDSQLIIKTTELEMDNIL